MRKLNLKKYAAALAACTIMASALPVIPNAVTANAAKNLISNSTFESGTTDWGTYKESGGSCTLTTSNGRLALNVNSVGKVNYAVQVYYDIIPLYKNGVYRLKYDISSSVDRYVEGMIQQNGGDYQAYTWKGLNLTSTPQTVDYQFTMTEETDIMAKLVFNCGIQTQHEGELPAHTIYLDNVSLELVDDSKVDYSTTETYENDININQVGYRPDSKKTAVFRNVSGQSEFSVVNASTNQTVYTGKLENRKDNSYAAETNYTGDFSSVKTAGRYYIKCNGLDDSYTFEIGDNVYSKLLDESVRMLYLQRCGSQVNDSTFGHAACHTSLATVYGTNQKMDVSGGWHDAGDYGRYVVPGAKTIADLLYAYSANKSLYGDSIGIKESGNGTPDILDEARYELEWMLKMQDSNGGVHHKVSCATFPGFVMPTAETGELIVTPVSTTATADFCASMALAYEFYKDIDGTFANKCLTAAKNAWGFLQSNPNFIFQNPADIVTGDYGDKSDKDERYWAAAQMYRATKDSTYLTEVERMGAYKGMDWNTMGDYGNIALLTMDGIDKNSSAYINAKDAVLKEAKDYLSVSKVTDYGVSVVDYYWGSNMGVANSGVVLGLAYQLTGDSAYLDCASQQLNYLLGVNPLGTSFVTGYGTVAPEHPHHRPSVAMNKAMPAMLVGGVNPNLEDSAAMAYCKGNPSAKCYVDNSESYSTNEITIYWNSPLTYLLSMTDADAQGSYVDPYIPVGDTVWGDANCDGLVKINDAVLVLQSISSPDKYGRNGSDSTRITEKGEKNADVFKNGDGLSAMDALSIQKYLIGSITKLPESYMDTPVVTTTTTARTTTTTTTTTKSNQPSVKLTPTKSNNTMFDDFTTGSAKYFIASDGWTNGKPFDCWWYKENTSLSNGVLSLTIDKERNANDKNPDWDPAYSGAEYRTNDFYGYGYYETSMKAIKNDGVVSSFFTYTGPSDNNPWDEIDIEILGKDTTKVQLNYYTNGVGNHEYMYDLGFDASEGFHKYGFDWQPDKIVWYVDGKAVYTAYENIPSTPGKIMMNTWPGRTVDDWLKAYNGKTPLTAQYQWVAYNKSSSGNNDQPYNPGTDTNSGMNANATMVADFTKGASKYFIASDGWTNGKPFDCWWYKENTSLSNGMLSLTIDKERNANDKNSDWDPAYSGAEYRTNDFYSYGYYETSMKAIKNDGVVSSFFTYTGPSDNNPWDEIDIEILGKDTTKVQLNYYTNGVGNHEYMYDLGFDASQDFHRYGFDWQRDHITWYVDGKPVYTAYNSIPSTPGKIMMNTWPGRTVDDWLKAYNGKTPLTAYYKWVTYNKQ